jgi:SAM-dependent methyltransferase
MPSGNAVGYDTFFRVFDSALMQQIRREAYGEDIGQHSWVTASQLRVDVARLKLSASSELLDLGCGPCGPLTFVVSLVRCNASGVDASAAALESGRTRAAALGVSSQVTLRHADLNEALPFAAQSFDAAMSLDVILHLRDRSAFFREVLRILRPGGRFLFTDAAVLTGAISNDEARRRSAISYAQFVPPGLNEKLLASAGLRLLETENRTSSTFETARARLTVYGKYRTDLELLSGAQAFHSQLEYLETVAELARRAALSRMMYLAEKPLK